MTDNGVGARPTETMTGSLRRKLVEFSVCPTCHQTIMDGGVRELAEKVGIGHTTLWRFIKGGDMTGRNLDLVASFLDGIGR